MIFWMDKKYMIILLCLLVLPFVSYGEIHFRDVTKQYGVGGYSTFGGHGICWVDVNGDGKLDIYVKNAAGAIYHVPNNLFINYGEFFLEEAASRGVTDAYGLGTHGAVFADIDNDEDFDLFSTTTFDRSPAHNHIYQNDTDGYFSDIINSITPPQEINTSARGVAAADFDGDGDMDFFFSNALPNIDPYNPSPFPPKQTRNFYVNNGDGTFTRRFRGIYWKGFVQGVVAIDIDGDGDIDIAEAKWTPPSTIYLNDGKGHFTDAGDAMGLPQTLGVRDGGMTFADVDNDSDLDLAMIGPRKVDLYSNTENFFTLKQKIIPDMSSGGAHVCFGDFDQDGDLDIYIADADYFNVLLQNDQNDSNWIQVDIIDHSRAIGGIGTKLDLYVAGHLDEPQFFRGHREIRGEYGYLGQDMPTVHFGAPGGNNYDLKVTFFDGLEKVVENITHGQKIQVNYTFVFAPLNFTGSRNENRSLFFRESLILLEWDENPANENIHGHRIYEIIGEQWTLLMETNPDTFSYMLRNVDKNKQFRFALTAVDRDNIEGEAAYLTID